MPEDIETLRLWIRIVLIITAICTTSVPVLYAFSPWRSRLFGRLFMLQAISFAVAMDLSVLLSFWQPKNILIIFWINAIILSGIAASTAALAVMMWVVPRRARKKNTNAAK